MKKILVILVMVLAYVANVNAEPQAYVSGVEFSGMDQTNIEVDV